MNKSTTSFSIKHSYYLRLNDHKKIVKNFADSYALVKLQLKDAKSRQDKNYIQLFSRDLVDIKLDEAAYFINHQDYKLALEQLPTIINNPDITLYQKAQVSNLYGLIHLNELEFEKAIKYYLDALNIIHENDLNAYYLKNTLLNNLAIEYRRIGENSLAEKYIMLVLKQIEEDKESHELTKVKAYTNAALLTNDRKSQLSLLESVYDIFKKYPTFRDINYIDNLVALAVHHEKDGNYNDAYNILKEGYDYAQKNREDVKFVEYFRWYSYLDAITTNDSRYCIDTMEKTKALLLTKFDQYSNRLFRIYETLKGCYYQNNDIEKSYDYSMLMMFILANEFDKNNLNINFKINDYLQDKKKAIHEFIYQSMIISSDSPRLSINTQLKT